jgi:hypothetical protein
MFDAETVIESDAQRTIKISFDWVWNYASDLWNRVFIHLFDTCHE